MPETDELVSRLEGAISFARRAHEQAELALREAEILAATAQARQEADVAREAHPDRHLFVIRGLGGDHA